LVEIAVKEVVKKDEKPNENIKIKGKKPNFKSDIVLSFGEIASLDQKKLKRIFKKDG
jgi:hypothetical protein